MAFRLCADGVTNSVANTACFISPAVYGHILGTSATDDTGSHSASTDQLAAPVRRIRTVLFFSANDA